MIIHENMQRMEKFSFSIYDNDGIIVCKYKSFDKIILVNVENMLTIIKEKLELHTERSAQRKRVNEEFAQAEEELLEVTEDQDQKTV